MIPDSEYAPGREVFDGAKAWPVPLAAGIVTAVIGAVVLAWPGETLAVSAALFGLQLAVFGWVRLVGAFSSGASAPVVRGLVGVAGIVVGAVVFSHPFETVAVFATLLGVAWVVGGVADLVEVIGEDSGDLWASGMSPAVTIVVGAVLLLWPDRSLTVVTTIGGFYLVVVGSLLCLGALSLRRSSV
ncbi:MAG: HdeD family acid-resistance protein [Acidimicrobiales bacterium]